MITAKLFKNGQNQAIRIPKDFEFKDVNEVTIHNESDRTIIEPVLRMSWLSYVELSSAETEFMTERHELLWVWKQCLSPTIKNIFPKSQT